MFLMPAAINRIRHTTGTGNPQLDQDIVQLVEYSKGVFEKYCRHILKTDICAALKNKTIVELGPGDTLATGLFFLAYGAARVVYFDRFKLIVNSPKNTLIARQIISILTEPQRLQLQTILSFDNQGQMSLDITRLQYQHSLNEKIGLENNSVDIIVSNAVLEHVQNLDALFASMYRILKPGGIMVHAADLKSHDLHHTTELDFLTVPDWLWWLMTFYRGAPNRKRWSYFKNLLDVYNFELTFLKTTSSLPSESIRTLRRKYPEHAKRFKDEDLSCGGFLFSARKP
jgi:SAM-dependent methyltransferase